MVRVERKINKKIIISLILLVALIGLIVISTLLNALGGETSGGSTSTNPPLEVLTGESTYGKYNLAYPKVSDAQIQYIGVSDKANSFKLIRPDEDGDMVLYYTNQKGESEVYYPNVLESDANIEYSALYTTNSSDGLGMIPMVSYLCSAVGITAFQERIELSADAEERAAQLTSFGFGASDQVAINFAYTVEAENEGDEPETKRHTIKIGKKTVAGSGRYFMIDNRDYIYCSSFDYFEYGLQGFTSFIKPYLVTEGMSGDDSVLAAYLTQEFTEWKNTVHDTLGDVVTAGSQVIVDAQTIVPSDPYGTFEPSKDNVDGYRYGDFEKTTFYLDGLEKDSAYSRLLAALVGQKVGKYYNYDDPAPDKSTASLFFTLTSQSKAIDFSEKDSVTYEYDIYAIESVLTDTAEYDAEGTPVGDNKLVKIAYSFKVDGVEIGEYLCHAVIDLTDERLPADARSALSASSVGELEDRIKFSIEYTVDNAVKFEAQYVICDILEIYDSNGNPISEVAEDSVVVYRYYLIIDGERDENLQVGTVVFGDPDEEDEDTKNLREALVGQKISYHIELNVMSYVEYSEILYDFITYKVAGIEYFVTSELVTSFGYVNASDRDPFFGESYYSYTDEMKKEKNSLYGINADVCISIVKYFMGVSSDAGSSSSATGLSGAKTVELGITPESMERYGLYAYTLYIELPRGIYSLKDENYDNENELDNYGWRDTISFYLYISEEQPDGTRYIASDMYDLIAVIDGEMFKFLEYDFSEFWARRTLLLVDFKYVENMKFHFGMDDLKGDYNLGIAHDTLYFENGKPTTSDNNNADIYNVSEILVTQFGDCAETVFSNYLAEKGVGSAMLHEYYSDVLGDDSMLMGGRDYLGSANYKNFIYLLYGIHYTGYLSDLTEEEKNDIRTDSPMMKMSVQLDRQAYSYTYDFHRVDDRRIMVTLYRTDAEGNRVSEAVSDFYISTFAFKKIVRAFFDVLNLKTVDNEVGYPKED